MTTKKKIIVSAVIFAVVGLMAAGIFYLIKPAPPTIETATVKRGDIIQEVSVTGTVKPAESVELGFEKSGKVSAINVKVGDSVKKNQLLISLASRESSASVSQSLASLASAKAMKEQYQASLSAAQIKLAEMKLGTRQEEITIAETSVSNAKLSVTDAEKSLAEAKIKADYDLESVYDTAISAANNSIGVATNALYTITDIQVNHFMSTDANSSLLADKKQLAVFALLGETNGGRWWNAQLSALNGGAKKQVTDALVSGTQTEIDSALIATQSSLQKMRDTAYAVAIIPEMTATEITNLNAAKNNINYEISTINSKISSIQTQKSLNQNSISAAENSLTTAQNNLRVAETQLALKKAGYTNEQIKAQESAVKQAEANLKAQNAQIQFAQSSLASSSAELAKNYLRSPIEGVVTEVNAKVGEIIGMSSPAVKIISKAKFQIETDIPEADIAKIKVGDKATLDLDALGSDIKLNATVLKIDPAEIMIEGVPTYKVTLQFDENDGRVKSGMTANLDILTAKADNALYVPRRAVISEAGKKFVQKYTNKEKLEYAKFEIEIGLSGSDGEMEVLSGLKEGEEIIVYIEQK